MATRRTSFEQAKKKYQQFDILGSIALFAVGIVAPLANPGDQIVESWRRA